MTEEIKTEQVTEVTTESAPDERSLLMQRARLMNIKISNNIGIDALKAKITAHLEAESKVKTEDEPEEVPPEFKAEPVPARTLTASEKKAALRKKLMKEAMKLVRLRITNLDPKKKDLPGEILTVANRYIGTVRKFIPFGDQTENGYHVPNCIYQMMKERKFLHIRTVKTKYDGDRVETSYVPEFALEVLPQLTPADLKKLALQQAAARGEV